MTIFFVAIVDKGSVRNIRLVDIDTGDVKDVSMSQLVNGVISKGAVIENIGIGEDGKLHGTQGKLSRYAHYKDGVLVNKASIVLVMVDIGGYIIADSMGNIGKMSTQDVLMYEYGLANADISESGNILPLGDAVWRSSKNRIAQIDKKKALKKRAVTGDSRFIVNSSGMLVDYVPVKDSDYNIILPYDVVGISRYALDSCRDKVESITLHHDFREFEERALERTNIKELIIPDKVEFIPSKLCYMCSKLQRIKIGKSVKDIQYGAFTKIHKKAVITYVPHHGCNIEYGAIQSGIAIHWRI